MLFLRLVLRNAQNGHYGKYIVAKIISLVYYCHKCLNRHSELNPENTSSKMIRTCTNIILKPKYQILSHCLDDGVPSQHHITDWSPVDATIFRQNKFLCYPCMTYMSYVCAPFCTLQISRQKLCLYMYQLLMLLIY